MERYRLEWQNLTPKSGIRYICGYCGTDTAPAFGFHTNETTNNHQQGFILICSNCNRPTFVDKIGSNIVSTTPTAKMGKEINGLPGDIGKLYDEARLCTSAGAYTAAILTCRKILMHVAVEKEAPLDQPFIKYVEYLASKGYIPHDGQGWVDHIRTKSNEANHEIKVMDKEDAEDLVTFTEMLLRLVYEFKNRLSRKTTSDGPTMVVGPGTPTGTPK
ncbi:MAG: DUF4145 domain-containing protein [Chloroflexi bacterium]|nr:MAG: DUF4145 domain-containing protein [Chloroflexota bacterium]